MTTRFLTKSRFKLALECPTKLHYTGKKEFINARNGDAFMAALADGGFQVGELAKLMHPEGIEVTSKVHLEALEQTAQLLQRENVTIFEGALAHDLLFVRVDILRKQGNSIELIEVKAKSYSSSEPMTSERGKIKPALLPYLQDVAFQTHVLRLACPHLTVTPFLMMADKNASASVDQLNQRFKIVGSSGKHRVETAPGTSAETIGAPVLTKVDVSALVEQILKGTVTFPGGERLFAAAALEFATYYANDKRATPAIGAHCAKCEFKSMSQPKASGFHHCWKQSTGWSDADFLRGSVLDLWNFRGKDDLIQRGIFALDKVAPEDLKYAEGNQHLSRSQRQWMQVSGQWPGGGDHFLDRAGIARESAGWAYPLHFIDFETSRTAIPFHAGRKPYEQVAFQFSHHVMSNDGKVAHAGQFLEATPGVFPNYAFVRELRRQLCDDNGTILRWATHENSVLRDIWRQLEDDPSPPDDRAELQAFILDVTSDGERIGRRTMVDLCKLAEHYYFHPLTRGSCSIKKVLPAVLQSSAMLRERYSAPVYGSENGPSSLNFWNWTWWREQAGSNRPLDPYSMLGPVADIAGIDSDADKAGEETLSDGGAAMHAYGRLQYETLSEPERAGLSAALLKYCELDTFAMVMVWEAWNL